MAPGLHHHPGHQRRGAHPPPIDRDSEIYKHIYKQRTATERINSQAKELGIERPRLRNGQAIANQNTLIYVLINLRALHRVQQKKHDQAAP